MFQTWRYQTVGTRDEQAGDVVSWLWRVPVLVAGIAYFWWRWKSQP